LSRIRRSAETEGEEIVDHAHAFFLHPSRELKKFYGLNSNRIAGSSPLKLIYNYTATFTHNSEPASNLRRSKPSRVTTPNRHRTHVVREPSRVTTPNRHRTHVVREPSRVTTHVGHPLIIIICSTNHNQKLHSTTRTICCTKSPKSQERHCSRRLITARSHQSHKSVTAADVSSRSHSRTMHVETTMISQTN
jgi:hypothetical protein